jgi:hypothetical protein
VSLIAYAGLGDANVAIRVMNKVKIRARRFFMVSPKAVFSLAYFNRGGGGLSIINYKKQQKR